MKILDLEFNKVVLEMGKQVKYTITGTPPESFEELKNFYERYGWFGVDANNSDNTIFGDSDVNYAFRAWHDYCHILKNADFSKEGEYDTYVEMVTQMYMKYGTNFQTNWFNRILDCEVNGQFMYYEKHNKFPDNQYEFASQYLELEDHV